jgi:hypothetical protein
MELNEIVQGLEPRLLETLASIRITFDGWQVEATLSFFLFGPPGIGRSSFGSNIIVIDTDDLPDGISVTGWDRYSDRVVEISTETAMETQIRALHDSGFVGGLDAARFDGGAEAVRRGLAPVSWIVKTHAATQPERTEWRTVNPYRNNNG